MRQQATTVALAIFMCSFGAALASASSSICDNVAGNLVQNCGFETGDFSSWTHTGNTADDQVNTSLPHSGTYGAVLGPQAVDFSGAAYLSQSVSLDSGAPYLYTITFYLADILGPNGFQVSWNGSPLLSFTDINFGWQQFNFTGVMGSVGQWNTLTFEYYNLGGSFLLDDVVVLRGNQIPEPTSVALLGTAAFGLAGLLRRKRML